MAHELCRVFHYCMLSRRKDFVLSNFISFSQLDVIPPYLLLCAQSELIYVLKSYLFNCKVPPCLQSSYGADSVYGRDMSLQSVSARALTDRKKSKRYLWPISKLIFFLSIIKSCTGMKPSTYEDSYTGGGGLHQPPATAIQGAGGICLAKVNL